MKQKQSPSKYTLSLDDFYICKDNNGNDASLFIFKRNDDDISEDQECVIVLAKTEIYERFQRIMEDKFDTEKDYDALKIINNMLSAFDIAIEAVKISDYKNGKYRVIVVMKSDGGTTYRGNGMFYISPQDMVLLLAGHEFPVYIEQDIFEKCKIKANKLPRNIEEDVSDT